MLFFLSDLLFVCWAELMFVFLAPEGLKGILIILNQSNPSSLDLCLISRYDTMHTPAAKSIMQQLEQSLALQEEKLAEMEKEVS